MNGKKISNYYIILHEGTNVSLSCMKANKVKALITNKNSKEPIYNVQETLLGNQTYKFECRNFNNYKPRKANLTITVSGTFTFVH